MNLMGDFYTRLILYLPFIIMACDAITAICGCKLQGLLLPRLLLSWGGLWDSGTRSLASAWSEPPRFEMRSAGRS